MTPSEVTRIGREALWMVLTVGGPVLAVCVLVGAVVSVLQAIAQVHEQTLAFLPKLLAVAAVLAVASGWMLEQTVAYSRRSFAHAAEVTK